MPDLSRSDGRFPSATTTGADRLEVEGNASRKLHDPEFDQALGRKVRAARAEANLSQSALGAKLGITFQQVQKYERGRDRIAASTLQAIGEALGRHPGTFFEGSFVPSGDAVAARETVRLVHSIERLPGNVRKRILALIDAVRPEPEGSEESGHAPPGAGLRKRAPRP